MHFSVFLMGQLGLYLCVILENRAGSRIIVKYTKKSESLQNQLFEKIVLHLEIYDFK